MYNLNELAIEVLLEKVKQTSNNPLMKLAIDGVSYEYNRGQYNDCLRHIDEENNQIASIYNHISKRGGFVTPDEMLELQQHIKLRSGYEAKSMKFFLSGSTDIKDIRLNLGNY